MSRAALAAYLTSIISAGMEGLLAGAAGSSAPTASSQRLLTPPPETSR